MPYQPHDLHEDDSLRLGPVQGGQLVDQTSSPDGHYGVAVRDMFSDAGWTPAEPVRARDWRDNGTGLAVPSSETTFD